LSAFDAPAAVTAEGLRYRYPKADRDALDGVGLTVAPGEVVGVLGPNGGGKTTLFRLLSTLLRPTLGSASVYGHDVVADPTGARRALGVVFQSPSLDDQLSVIENLKVQAALYALPWAQAGAEAEALLGRLGMSEQARERVGRLSGGQRRRVELARALLHGPRVLLLDEPTVGLDPAARRELWAVLHELREARGMTVVLTTHLMEDASHCDRLVLLAQGRVVATDTPSALRSRVGEHVIAVTPRPPATAEQVASRIAEALGPFAGDAGPRVVGGVVRFEHAEPPAAVAAIEAAAHDAVERVTIGPPSLDDVFVHLTSAPQPEPVAVA